MAEDDQNRINRGSPRFKAPLEPIMEDETISRSMAAPYYMTAPIPARPISTAQPTTARRRRRRSSSPRRQRGTTNPLLASIRGIAMSGQNLRPHRITIYRAQNIVEKIVSFCREGNRGAVVLSASSKAIISSVLIRGFNSPVDISLEGRFEILSLAGRIIESEVGVNGHLHLIASLVLQDMSVIGGIITGPLIAASRMEVLMGTYPHANIIPTPTNLNISQPSSSHFDTTASSSRSNQTNQQFNF